MNRITRRMSELRQVQEKALALFITAGFPNIHDTSRIVLQAEDGGADLIEIGMPFSDPLADGPVIQKSSARALRNGVTLSLIFRQVQEIRRRSEIPIILMGYLNPIVSYGAKQFFMDAENAGVDGLILPELPLEETARFTPMISPGRLAQILLVAPTTATSRVKEIDQASSGFLYCVSATGVTGRRSTAPDLSYIAHIKRTATRNPVLVGFGIRRPGDVRRVSSVSDGVIVGSACIEEIERNAVRGFSNWVRRMKQGPQQ